MGNSPITTVATVLASAVSITIILAFIAKASVPGPLQDTVKIFIAFPVAFFIGAVLAALLFGGISLITPTHPFACIVGNSICKYTSYYWIAVFLMSLFMLVVGILSTWGAWYLVQKYIH